MAPSYLIQGDLSENQIEADVSNFLGWCSPNGEHFKLLDINEEITGADKKFCLVTPIFIQFKKSTGLKPISTHPVKDRKNSSPLHDIRKFRNENGMCDSPSLFFQLRKKAATASDLQHNILMLYNSPPTSNSIYVAPLCLYYKEYNELLFDPHYRFINYPFVDRYISIMSRTWSSHYGFIPFLRSHVSIVPHERVNDHHHYYSYSAIGDDISWHSPSIINRNPSRLSDFFVKLYGRISYIKDGENTIEKFVLFLHDRLDSIGESADKILIGESNIEKMQSHGKWVRDTHGIRQFLLLSKT